MRPQQWVKNVLVLAAPVAAGRLDDATVWWPMLGALVAFCAAASAIYLVNDVRDLEADRRHPTKRERPIAAGLLAPWAALAMAAVLGAGAIVLAAVIEPLLVVIVVAYLVLTIAYSLGLKHVAGLDLLAIAAGFVLRAVAGGVATDTELSAWFLAVTSTGSLLVVVGKRLGELVRTGSDARRILASYSRQGLERLAAASAAATVIGYLMWAGNGEVVPAGEALVSGVPFAGALGRYVWVVAKGRGADPEEVLSTDRVFQVLVVVWAIVYGIGVYA